MAGKVLGMVYTLAVTAPSWWIITWLHCGGTKVTVLAVQYKACDNLPSNHVLRGTGVTMFM